MSKLVRKRKLKLHYYSYQKTQVGLTTDTVPNIQRTLRTKASSASLVSGREHILDRSKRLQQAGKLECGIFVILFQHLFQGLSESCIYAVTSFAKLFLSFFPPPSVLCLRGRSVGCWFQLLTRSLRGVNLKHFILYFFTARTSCCSGLMPTLTSYALNYLQSVVKVVVYR